MAKGKVSEDVVKLIVEAETSKLQQAIHESKKSLKGLEDERKRLLEQQAAFKAAHLTESKEYSELTRQIVKNTQAIANEKANHLALTKALGTNAMTMSQLRKEAKLLQKQLDSTSESLEPEAFAEYARKLKEVNDRMAELKNTAKNITPTDNGGGVFKKLFGADLDLVSVKSMLAAAGIAKVVDFIKSLATEALSKMQELVTEGIEMAKTSDGIRHAFDQLNRPDILDELRKATHGTVTDIELMKTVVKAKDFRLPFEQLGKYLEFAQLKASQTGQSVDYMTESIINGLGRKSKLILDNLGISAAELSEKMAKGADMATAVGEIIDKQLAEQGEHYEDAAEREKRAVTEVQNAQRELGEELLPLTEAGSNMWLSIEKSALQYFKVMVKGVKDWIAKFVDLYNNNMWLRFLVAELTVSFKNMWTIVSTGCSIVIDNFKMMGKNLMNVGKIIEGIFTMDPDKIKQGFMDMVNATKDNALGQLKNLWQMGKDLGQNFVDGYNSTINGHITAPSFDAEGGGSGTPYLQDLGNDDDGNKKKGSGSKEDNDRLKLLKASHQKILDQENKLYNESIRIYKKQLADKALLQAQYDAIALSLKAAHAEKVLAAEKDQLEAVRNMTFKDAKLKQQAIDEQQRNVEKAEHDFQESRLAAYQNFQKNMEQLDKGGMSDLERMEAEHKLQLQVLDGYYKASLQYAQDNNEELLSIGLAYDKAKEQLEKDYTEKIEQEKFSIRQQYGLVKMQEQYDHELELLKKHLEQKKLTQEEYALAVAALDQKYEEKKFQVRQQYGLVKQSELYEKQKEDLQKQHDEGYISESEYQESLRQMKMDNWKQQFDYYSSLFGNAISALQDAELANVNAKYDAQIDAARKAGQDTTELENKKANEQLKIQKKYADVNFAIKASQIIADTSVSIMKALAELGPIAGPVAAALMGVTGAAQLAAANAERMKVKRMTLNGSGTSAGTGGARVATGREEGGWLDVEREQDGKTFHAKYDPGKRGFVNQPTVIVGEGPRPKEWIASNAAVENPTIAPFINVLDRVQRAGQLRTFDFTKYLNRKQMQATGYVDGGSLASEAPNSPKTPVIQHYNDSTFRRLVDVLERMDRDGIPAHLGLDEFDAKEQLRNRSREFSKKG